MYSSTMLRILVSMSEGWSPTGTCSSHEQWQKWAWLSPCPLLLAPQISDDTEQLLTLAIPGRSTRVIVLHRPTRLSKHQYQHWAACCAARLGVMASQSQTTILTPDCEELGGKQHILMPLSRDSQDMWAANLEADGLV